MRGQNVKMNLNGDGEVDENFWAQAAADQAAGRSGEQEGDDSRSDVTHLRVVTNSFPTSHERRWYPVQYTVLP
jgi:hypothetical protein